jgi:hypothetical protein
MDEISLARVRNASTAIKDRRFDVAHSLRHILVTLSAPTLALVVRSLTTFVFPAHSRGCHPHRARHVRKMNLISRGPESGIILGMVIITAC